MQRITPVLATMAFLTPSMAWSDWKYAHWGATPEQVALASAGAVKVLPAAKRQKHAAPYNSMSAAEGSYVDGKLRVNLRFFFDLKSGGLNCIIFNSVSQSAGEPLKKMFVGLNGSPHVSRNNKGLGMQTFSWSTKKDEIGLTLMDGDAFATQCVPRTQPWAGD